MRAGRLGRGVLAAAMMFAALPAAAFAPSEFTHFADVLVTGGDTVAQFHSVHVTLDTSAMIASGAMKADGSDLAIAWDSTGAGNWIELDAHLRPAPNMTLSQSTATEVWFAVPDPAGWQISTSDFRYRIYYGRPSATLAQ